MVDRDNDPEQKQRTGRQNNSLHLYLDQVAQALNDSGQERKVTVTFGADVPWSAETIKEVVWRTIQYRQTGKLSTTELTTKEYGEVYETVNRFLGESFGIHVPLPSQEEIRLKNL